MGLAISLPNFGPDLVDHLLLGSLSFQLKFAPVNSAKWTFHYQWPGRFGMSLWKTTSGWAFRDQDGRAIVAGSETEEVTLSERSPECWHFFNRRVLPRLGVMRGATFLHGSAVALPNGDSLVIVGPSGAGKSTLAAALVHLAGAVVLADDYAYLEALDHGYRLRASENLVRLRQDTLQFFQASPNAPAPTWLTKAEDGKTCCRFSPGDGRPVPIRKIVVLSGQPCVHESPNVVAKYINANLLQFNPPSLAEIQRHWCVAAEIVNSVSIQVITRDDVPLDQSSLSRLVESVLSSHKLASDSKL